MVLLRSAELFGVCTGPALGMFEVFGRTGPPILGGRHFGP